jgi:hypothetical protein
MFVPIYSVRYFMDWDLAIRRNSEALVEIEADLFSMLGIVALTDTVSRLPWPAYRAVLRVLRPAESALRRLIVVAARGVVVKPATVRSKPAGAAAKRKKRGTPRVPSFQLFDPHPRIILPRRRTPRRGSARLHMFNADGELVTIWPPPPPAKAPVSHPPKAPDGMVNAHRLIRRLEALEAALADLPRQAMRLARWRMRQEMSPQPQLQVAAPAGPSAGTPQTKSPRSRRASQRVRLAGPLRGGA